MRLDLRLLPLLRALRHRGAVAVLLLGAGAALGVAPTPAGAADPIQDADAEVQALREAADRASQAYFDALIEAQSLDARITELEARLPRLESRQRRLRRLAEDRAVAAYKRAGVQLGVFIDSGDALTAARRRQWLDRLNANDNEAFTRLTRVSQQLDEHQQALHDARVMQESVLADLDAAGRDVDAKLRGAVERRTAIEAAANAEAAAAAPSDAGGNGGDGGGSGGGKEKPEIPTEPPPGYVPTPGVHPFHDDPWMVCTRAHESSGNYQAVNPAGPYLGAYQFLQASWNSGANHAGRTDLIGVPPHTASEYDQDDVAWTVYQWQGKGPWGGRC